MSLIVEDGSAVPDAESLASVAFADAYHASRGNVSWANLSEEVKEQLLRKATDYVVAKYAGNWASSPVYVSQALPFPAVAYGATVPVLVQQAVAELALIARTTPLMPTVTRGKKKVKVGPLEVEYDGNSPTAADFAAASLRLATFLSTNASGVFSKLVRT